MYDGLPLYTSPPWTFHQPEVPNPGHIYGVESWK